MTRGPAPLESPALTPLLCLKIGAESDIVLARQRARQIAALLGFGAPDQAGLATAVSEIVRNAVLYAGEAKVDFEIDMASRPQFLWVGVADHRPGILQLQEVLAGQFQSKSGLGTGLSGARRLTDK